MLRINGGESMPQCETIPSPSFGINHILGGGFWTGRFSLLWGNYSCGKTTFLLHTLANAQDMGYIPVIVDSENSYTDEWGAKCGIDLSQRIWMKSNKAEEILKEVTPLMRSKVGKYAFLIDSINAIQSEDFFEAKGGMASGARARSKMFMTLAEELHPERNIVLMVAQQTLDLSSQMGARPMAKLGNADNHFCTNIIKLLGSGAKDKLEREEKTNLITNKTVEWRIDKCKQAPVEGTVGSYWFSPQDAHVDNVLEILHIAVYNDVIQNNGAWFTYEDKKVQGLKAMRDYVDDNPSILAKIVNELKSSTIQFEGGQDDE